MEREYKNEILASDGFLNNLIQLKILKKGKVLKKYLSIREIIKNLLKIIKSITILLLLFSTSSF